MNKYKEKSPNETVNDVLNILDKFGLDYKFTNVINQLDGLYSCFFRINDFNFVVGGKGTTAMYSRASACGEMMERLQNLHTIKLPFHLNESEGGFTYFPDESDFDSKDLLSLPTSILNDVRAYSYEYDKYTPTDSELIDVWSKKFPAMKKVPFYSVVKGETVELPYDVINFLTKSNGMSAGNSFNEALVQSLSEIMERYSLTTILRGKLCPPEIPLSYIKDKAPETYKVLQELDMKRFSIKIFDASLGKGYPVVGAVIVDKTQQRYKVKFGSHPVFGIAVERCITELFQYNKFTERLLNNRVKWNSYTSKNYNAYSNLIKSISKNTNSFADEFFKKNADWEWKEWKEIAEYDNAKGCKYLIDLFLTLSDDIYIREHSYSGFTALKVYIPGINLTHTEPLSHSYYLDDDLSMKMQNLPLVILSMTQEEKREVLEALSKDIAFFNRYRIRGSQFHLTDSLVSAFLYMDLGMREEALVELKNSLRVCPQRDTASIISIIRYLELSIEGFSFEDIENMIKFFYGEEYLSNIRKLHEGDYFHVLFNELGGEVETLKKGISDFISKFREMMINNPINQSDLKDKLDFSGVHYEYTSEL